MHFSQTSWHWQLSWLAKNLQGLDLNYSLLGNTACFFPHYLTATSKNYCKELQNCSERLGLLFSSAKGIFWFAAQEWS